MAKADKKYTFQWFMTLGFDEWSRSRVWIANQLDANRSAGYLSDQQFKAAWDHQAQVMQDKVDDKNKKNPPVIVEQTPSGQVSGSAQATADTSSDNPGFFEKAWRGIAGLADPNTFFQFFGLKGGNGGGGGSPKPPSVWTLFIAGMLIFFVINIFRKK